MKGRYQHMRNPLNKSRKPLTKEEPMTEEQPTMDPVLRRIMDKAEELKQAEPENRNEFLRGIEQAQAAQVEAIRKKETASTLDEFNKACDDESRARDKEAFFRRLLDKLDSNPRMDEAEYYEAREDVDRVVREVAAEFVKIARRCIPELVEARKKYIQIQKDADRVLSALDASANVLQTKYRYRTTEHSGGVYYDIYEGEKRTPAWTERREDPNEWTRHTVRYSNTGRGYGLLTADQPRDRYGNISDYTVGAAWEVAGRIAGDNEKKIMW